MSLVSGTEGKSSNGCVLCFLFREQEVAVPPRYPHCGKDGTRPRICTGCGISLALLVSGEAVDDGGVAIYGVVRLLEMW